MSRREEMDFTLVICRTSCCVAQQAPRSLGALCFRIPKSHFLGTLASELGAQLYRYTDRGARATPDSTSSHAVAHSAGPARRDACWPCAPSSLAAAEAPAGGVSLAGRHHPPTPLMWPSTRRRSHGGRHTATPPACVRACLGGMRAPPPLHEESARSPASRPWLLLSLPSLCPRGVGSPTSPPPALDPPRPFGIGGGRNGAVLHLLVHRGHLLGCHGCRRACPPLLGDQPA